MMVSSMITLIHHFDGRLQGAVLLSRAQGTIRLAVPGQDDAVLLRLQSGRWVCEDGSHVEIEFSAAEGGEAPSGAAGTGHLAPGSALDALAVA